MSNKGISSVFYSIRTKFLAIILVFIAALMLTVIGFINKTVSEVVLDEGLQKGLAVARGVASASADPMLTNDDLTLFTVIKGVTDDKGILYGIIVGRDNIIKAHSQVSLSNRAYAEAAGIETIEKGDSHLIKYSNEAGSGGVYDISVPITSVRLKEGFGTVHIGLSRRVIDEAVERVNRYIKYLTYAGLFIGGTGAVFITGIIINPLKELIKSTKALGEGDFEYRIKVKRRDELGTLMSSFNDMAEGLKQKQVIQDSFGRYVAPEVLDMILENKETWFKGTEKEVSVLFADIRGFTSFSERTSPDELIDMLNRYFTLMTQVVQKHRGYVDKFIGDAIMVVFGSPVSYPEHALQAARAACEMQEKLRGFNRERADDDQIDVGIGINSGTVVAGNLGSIQKMEYAVIGDEVNVSSRLCSAAKKREVIISASTHAMIKGHEFKFDELEAVSVKGKSEPIEIFSLIPRRSPDRKDDDGPGKRRGAST